MKCPLDGDKLWWEQYPLSLLLALVFSLFCQIVTESLSFYLGYISWDIFLNPFTRLLLMSISCTQQKNGLIFLQSFGGLWVYLNHLCWDFSMSSVYWFLVLFLFYVVVLSLLFNFGLWGYYFLVFSKVWLTCSGWSFPYRTYNRAGFSDRYCLTLDLS